MNEEKEIPRDHLLKLSKYKFYLTLPNEVLSNLKKKPSIIIEKMKKIIIENNMLPYYNGECEGKENYNIVLSNIQKSSMQKNISKKLSEISEKLKDSEENLGENEVREVLLSKAKFFKQIGDKQNALLSYSDAFTKTVSLGQKIDVFFDKILLGFALNDDELVKKSLKKVWELIEKGGDWERRNKYKVYNGLYLMSIRNFHGASKMFFDCISTFSSTELLSYKKFIFYTVVVGMFSLKRKDLKKKIIDSSHVLSIIDKIPNAKSFVNSFYYCSYNVYLKSLANISDMMKINKYLNRHTRFYVREMRVRAYSQVLTSYKTVSLSSISEQFGVSEQFMDNELSRFISSGRLNGKIDKVKGIVESKRPEFKNYYYHEFKKNSDLLLSRIKNLSRVIDL